MLCPFIEAWWIKGCVCLLLQRLEHTCTRPRNNNQRKDTRPFYSQTLEIYFLSIFIEKVCLNSSHLTCVNELPASHFKTLLTISDFSFLVLQLGRFPGSGPLYCFSLMLLFQSHHNDLIADLWVSQNNQRCTELKKKKRIIVQDLFWEWNMKKYLQLIFYTFKGLWLMKNN